MKADQYYFNRLGKDLRQIYHEIYTGLLSLEPSFPVTRTDAQVLSELFFFVRLDHPEIFWASGFSYRYTHGADTIDFEPEYLFRKKQILEHRSAMDARVRKLALKAQSMSEVEKELYIHDFILQNVHYDKLKKSYSHEIIGPLGQGVGVCEGIAKSVKILCDALGLWCIIAICGNNPEKGIKYRHAWNIVRLNGTCYHLDATFDNSLSADGILRYDYFNISDSFLFRDHEPVLYPVPECPDSGKAYYAEKKLVFTRYEDLRKRIAQTAKKKKTFVFQWRAGYLTREVFSELTNMIDEVLADSGLHVRLAINQPQAVLQLDYILAGQNELRMQEANEGEQDDASPDRSDSISG